MYHCHQCGTSRYAREGANVTLQGVSVVHNVVSRGSVAFVVDSELFAYEVRRVCLESSVDRQRHVFIKITQCLVVHFSPPEQCIAVQYSTVQWSAVRWSALQCSVAQRRQQSRECVTVPPVKHRLTKMRDSDVCLSRLLVPITFLETRKVSSQFSQKPSDSDSFATTIGFGRNPSPIRL